MPDNYFSDITPDDSYYRDILVAVEFGVVDIEAGEAFYPDEPATREFAAQTLNACLSFQPDEEAGYTYAEYADVSYPDDIQVAVNRGWFALSGNSFLPDQAITSEESAAALADAKAVIEDSAIDENYDSSYEFAEGVIVLPETADASISQDYTVTVSNCDTAVSAGDIFVVFADGYPVALKALEVTTDGETMTIAATPDGAENAIVSADSEGSIEIDLEDFEFNELTTYTVTDRSVPNAQSEEMTVELQSVDYDKNTKTLTASQKISLGGAAAGTISAKFSNMKLNHKENAITGKYSASITADTTVTTAVSFDFGSYAGIPSSIRLGYINIAGIGSISLDVECSIKGGVSMTWDGDLEAGVAYTRGDGFRLIKSFEKKGFTFTAEAEIRTGVRLSASISLLFVEGSIWGTVGVQMNFRLNSYDSGTPKTCTTISGHMYASVGAGVTINYIIDKESYNKTQDIFTESNSPVRAVYHYEDGALVSSCSRGEDISYTTSYSSKYFNPSQSYGQSSYGGSGTGGEAAPVVIWEYELDDSNNATITKYSGNASAVAVPSKLDGYTVTKIGSSAFSGNTTLRSVTMPNTVVEIDSRAFQNCTNLSSVSLSSSLETLGGDAFRGCSSLLEIEIPKSLIDAQAISYGGGPFYDSGLKTVTFESGTTQVVGNLFYGANNLKNVNLLDTITNIGYRAFGDCSALTDIALPQYITNIDRYAFNNCTGLTDIDIPDYVTEIGSRAFQNCTNLSSVSLSSSLETLGGDAFRGCSSLLEIEIPKSLIDAQAISYGGGPFYDSGLKTVTFESGTTQVAGNLFRGANNLENVNLLDTMTNIGDYAFCDCTALKNIDLPNSITKIGRDSFSGCTTLADIVIPPYVTSIGVYAFNGCTGLTNIDIPDYVTEIGSNAFQDCSNLSSITLSPNIKNIPNSAFENCAALESISIPASCTRIYDYAFKSCTALKSVEMQYGLESIGYQAFSECDALTSVSIPDSVTSLGSQAFYGCDGLSGVTFGIGLTEIQDSTFRLCPSLEEIVLPRYCTEVASNAFAENIRLTEVTIFPNMTSIENNAFSYPARTTVRGVSGSYAEEYAGSRNMPFENINIAATGLNFYKDELDFSGTNNTRVLPLSITPQDATSEITYTSADESVATVENGVVRSRGYGSTTITAQSASGARDTITINVLRSATSVSLDKTQLSLEVGGSDTLTATMQPSNATDKITWTTSAPGVATVTDGVVNAVGIGTAVITATTTSGKTASCTVSVTKTVTVTSSADAGGRVFPQGETPVNSAEGKTFHMAPDYGYIVKDVQVDGTSVGAVMSYTFEGLTENSTISAEFAKVDVTYENGVISISSEAALNDLKLIVAVYNDDGVLTDCEIKNVSAAPGEVYTESIAENANAKLMLWNDFNSIYPIWSNK